MRTRKRLVCLQGVRGEGGANRPCESRAEGDISGLFVEDTEQQNFTEARMNQTVKQSISTGGIVDYPVGDKPYSMTCDYMETCEYKVQTGRISRRW